MAIVIKPKKSETASAVPTTSDLAVGEICMNIADRKIYTRKSNNSIVVVSSHIDTDVGATSVGGDLTGTVSNASIVVNAVDGTHIALGSDAAGDIMYYNGTNYIRLAKGTATQVLTVNSGETAPEWTTASGVTLQQATAKAVTMAIALG
jgi:hypothetical protein